MIWLINWTTHLDLYKNKPHKHVHVSLKCVSKYADINAFDLIIWPDLTPLIINIYKYYIYANVYNDKLHHGKLFSINTIV